MRMRRIGGTAAHPKSMVHRGAAGRPRRGIRRPARRHGAAGEQEDPRARRGLADGHGRVHDASLIVASRVL